MNVELIEEIIDKLKYFVRLYSLNSLFVAGGYCRAKVMDTVEEIDDIDVASAHSTGAMNLCGLFSSEFLNTTPQFYHRTGTGIVEHQGIRIEFQNQSTNSYMHNEEVVQWMHKNGIRNNPLNNNLYGRDFGINSLSLSLKNGELYDLTKRAIPDFQSGRIASLLPPEMLVKYNPMVILRAIRFGIKYDFVIDPPLRKVMKEKSQSIFKYYSQERITKEIEKIMEREVFEI